jgi:DNA-binding NarL/FixJ family response regulator
MSIQLHQGHNARRQRAVASNLLATERIRLARLWEELCCGQTRLVDAFFTADRCYGVFTQPDEAQGPPLTGRRLTILHSILCAQGQKCVAIDLDLAPSTIALNARLALEALGVAGRASRVHPLLMAAAMSFCSERVDRQGWISTLHDGSRTERVVSIERPEQSLHQVLPPAELTVVAGLVEGLPYTTMGNQRGTSTRTIANQVTSVFRRLKVSGRNELVQWLFEHQTSDDALPLPLPPAPDPPSVPPASGAVTIAPPAGNFEECEVPRVRLYA